MGSDGQPWGMWSPRRDGDRGTEGDRVCRRPPPTSPASSSASCPVGSRCGGGMGVLERRDPRTCPHSLRVPSQAGGHSDRKGGSLRLLITPPHTQSDRLCGPSALLWRHEALQMSSDPNQLESHRRGFWDRPPPLSRAPPFLNPWPEPRESWTRASDWQRGTIRKLAWRGDFQLFLKAPGEGGKPP